MDHHRSNNNYHEKKQSCLFRIVGNFAWWHSFLLLVRGDIVVEVTELELICPFVTLGNGILVYCPVVLNDLFLAFPGLYESC